MKEEKGGGPGLSCWRSGAEFLSGHGSPGSDVLDAPDLVAAGLEDADAPCLSRRAALEQKGAFAPDQRVEVLILVALAALEPVRNPDVGPLWLANRHHQHRRHLPTAKARPACRGSGLGWRRC